MLCANSVVRGVYTSDKLYSFMELPADMKFKFSFHMSKWHDYFSWIELPQDPNGAACAGASENLHKKTITFNDEEELYGATNTEIVTEQQKDKMQKDLQKLLEARRD